MLVSQFAPDIAQGLLRSDAGNRISSAENQWIQTFGRAESGAAIGKDEWPSWRRDFFPQIGDDKYTIEVKRRARKAIEEGMNIQAGRAELRSNIAQKSVGSPPPAAPAGSSGEEKVQGLVDNLKPDEGWQVTPDGLRYRVKN